MKKIIRHFFNVRPKESKGMVLLLLIIMCGYLLPYLVPEKKFEAPPAALVGLLNASNKTTDAVQSIGVAGNNDSLFYFDPNTIDVASWEVLGVREKTALTIQHYLDKGGRFRQAADLTKIWGMPDSVARKLMPYVRIREKGFSKSTFVPSVITPIDINTADEAAWQSLPGIGAVLAKRIVRVRNQSGGFVSMESLKEVFGLRDSLLQQLRAYLVINQLHIPKQDINRASAAMLEQRAGIGAALAQAIVGWRLKQGRFEDFTAVQQVPGITSMDLEKIKRFFFIE